MIILLEETGLEMVFIWREGDSESDAHCVCHLGVNYHSSGDNGGRRRGVIWGSDWGFPDAEIRLADSAARFLLVQPAPR